MSAAVANGGSSSTPQQNGQLPNGTSSPGGSSPLIPAEPAANSQPLNSSLYVGDLDREVTESQIFELFSTHGPVASIRVCRDAVTRRSLGYAYVNYNTTVDPGAAERAMEHLNYHMLGSKAIRIMWSHRDPSARRSGVGNIFIKNLDKTIDNKVLFDTFSAFGKILSCKVAGDSGSGSKGYGFVHFEKEEAATMAIEKVNGMLLEGKKVFVGHFQKREERPDDGEARYTNVYVKNLAESVTDQQLQEMFGEYGDVTSAIVMRDEQSDSKGFGFVNFDKADHARAAVDALNGKEIDGKPLYAGRAQKKSERESELKSRFDEAKQERQAKYQGLNLYVKNLSDDVDDETLRQEFSTFGTISSAKVMRDSSGKSKGFGFVCFTSAEEATRATTENNGRMVGGKPIYVALAQRRDVRKAQLEQLHQRVPSMPAMPAPRGPPPGPMPGMFPPAPPFGAPQFYPPPAAMQPRGPPGPPMPGMYPPHMVPRGMPQGRGPGGRGRAMQPNYGPQGMPPQMMQHPMMPPMGPMQGPPMGPMGPGGRGGLPMMGGARGGGRGRGPRPDRNQGQGPIPGRGAAGPGRGGPGGRGPQNGAPPAQAAAGGAAGGAAAAPAAGQAAGAGTSPATGSQEGGGQLTTAMLAAANPDQQKQMLGERLFPLVQTFQTELAGKITGMLLEMDNSELLLLLESPDALESKVEEAIQVLKQHNALPPGVSV